MDVAKNPIKNPILREVMRPAGETREKSCSEHGTYTSEFRFNRWSGCPRCAEAELTSSQAREREEARIAGALRAIQIPKKFEAADLDNVDPGPRAKAAAWLERVVAGDSGGLLMLGDVGTGKTYVGIALAKAAARCGLTARYVRVSRYLREIKDTWGNYDQSESSVIARYTTPRVLVLDELGFIPERNSESDIVRVHELIESRSEEDLPTIYISNLAGRDPSRSMDLHRAMGERAYDRMREGAVVIGMTGESRRQPRAPG